MKADWTPLERELAQWRREGLHLPVWWRDDDAVAPTAALERLARLAEGRGLPVHIAVIPDLASDTLAGTVNTTPALVPVGHGWRHENRAPEGAKKAEFGHPRPNAVEEITAGLARLEALFGADLLPVFVPPWNRLDHGFAPVLAAAGYRGVSTYGARPAACAAAGLHQINTHIDPVFWRGHRGLADPETLIHGIVERLRRRRSGDEDAHEPLGLLTHHLVHTEDVWRFSADCLAVLRDGGAQVADLRRLI